MILVDLEKQIALTLEHDSHEGKPYRWASFETNERILVQSADNIFRIDFTIVEAKHRKN